MLRLKQIRLGALVLTLVAIWQVSAIAQQGTLAEPTSPPSPNAALHYQRALLYLAAIDKSQLGPIQKPIWEAVDSVSYQNMDASIKRLLYQGRLAIRNAGTGARLDQCDFGIDFRSHGAATPLPHAKPMVRLGRLLTLRGVYEMTRGNWQESAVIFFDGLRMGQHLNHQNTVAESLAGMEILSNNYYALAIWAAYCPNPKLVIRAQRMLETIADKLVDPTRTVTGELTILSRRLTSLRAAYPNGPWAELILEDLGEDVSADSLDQMRKKAAKAAIDSGVDKSVFENPSSFRKHVDRIAVINNRFTEAAAACMTLPAAARAKRGQEIYDKYNQRVGALGDTLAFNPRELGTTYAAHDAELVLARLALAVGASRTKEGFPESLDSVKDIFGGVLPGSPYDGSAVEYKRLNDGTGFYLSVAESNTESARFPQMTFSSVVPVASSDE